MAFCVYRTIWTFIHLLFTINEILIELIRNVKTKCIELWCRYEKHNLLADKHLIEENRQHFKKIPVHLVVVLGTEEPNFEALSRIIYWGLAAGIQHISFYDHQGVFIAKNYKLYEYLARWKKENDKIYWNVNKNGTCGSRVVYSNGLKKQLAVNFLSPEDGKVRISEICRNMAADTTVPSKNIDVQYLNSKLMDVISPDPELAIYFGQMCCTYGLLPWHIRLTEFVNIPSQSELNIRTFLNALAIYSKCEQRFGF